MWCIFNYNPSIHFHFKSLRKENIYVLLPPFPFQGAITPCSIAIRALLPHDALQMHLG